MFRFESYKIDTFSYRMKRETGILRFRGALDLSTDNTVAVKLRMPTYVENENAYVVGLDCIVSIFGDEVPPEERTLDKAEQNAAIFVLAGIVGFFIPQSGEKNLEEKLVKIQMPAVLFPYLRGAITTFLNNAGFGSSTFPLINMQQVALEQLKDVQVQTVQATAPPAPQG